MTRLNTLQILRAFAAISVLVTHVFQKSDYRPFGDYFLSGQYGVDIFFMLSGFLIFLTTKDGTDEKLFAKKRIFRIFPLYLVALLAYLTVYSRIEVDMGLSPIKVIQNILMLPWSGPIGYQSLIVGVAWSTVFEMFFYALFFLILIFKGGRNKIFYIIPVLYVLSKLVLMSGLVDKDTSFISLLLSLGSARHLLMFLMGCVICKLFIDDKIPRVSQRNYTFLLFLAVVAFCVLQLIRYNFYLSFLCASFLFIIVCEFGKYFTLKEDTFVVKSLIFLGDISYSIYLFHILVIKVCLYFFDFNIIQLLVCTLIFTVLISTLTYRTIEQPFIRLAKK